MLYVVEDMATDGVMDGWVVGWMNVEVLITNVDTEQAWKTNAKNFVIKIMMIRMRKDNGQYEGGTIQISY